MGAQASGLPQCGQGVQRLPGLADDHDQGMLVHQGVHVPELRGQGHLYGNAGHPLQVVLAHHAHMPAGAAGDDVDFLQAADVVVAEVEVLKVHRPLPDPGEDAPAQGLGLLHDLLEHEVLVAALLRRVDLPVDMGDLLFDGLHQVVVALDAVPGEHRHLPVVHVAHLPGVAQDGGDVAGQEGAPLPVA